MGVTRDLGGGFFSPKWPSSSIIHSFLCNFICIHLFAPNCNYFKLKLLKQLTTNTLCFCIKSSYFDSFQVSYIRMQTFSSWGGDKFHVDAEGYLGLLLLSCPWFFLWIWKSCIWSYLNTKIILHILVKYHSTTEKLLLCHQEIVTSNPNDATSIHRQEPREFGSCCVMGELTSGWEMAKMTKLGENGVL